MSGAFTPKAIVIDGAKVIRNFSVFSAAGERCFWERVPISHSASAACFNGMGSANDLLVADQKDRIAFSTPVIIIET